MAQYTADSVVIKALSADLVKMVDELKKDHATFEATKEGGESVTFVQALSLPTTEDEDDAIEGLQDFILEFDKDEDVNRERKSIYYANLSKVLSDAAEHFKTIAEAWGDYLPCDETPKVVTKQDLANQIKSIDDMFSTIVQWCEDPTVVGLPFSMRNVRGGSQVPKLDLPRVKIKESDTNEKTHLVLFVNGHKMNESTEPYSSAIKEHFSVPVSKFIESFNAQGHKITEMDSPVKWNHPDGAIFEIQFTR